MTPRLVTFDCAQTLLDVKWEADLFLRDCAHYVGLTMPPEAFPRYRSMFFERMPAFLNANRQKDWALGDQWWAELTRDWLTEFGQQETWTERLTAASDHLGFSKESILFRIYDDVLPCLDRLEAAGIRTAIISNWDYSLHRALHIFDIHHRFDLVLASMEEGVDKPDPRLFHLCLERLGVHPSEAYHVGDNPRDDIEGATAAGIRSVRIDRDGGALHGELSTLDHLEDSFFWSR